MIPDEYVTSLANFPQMLRVRGETAKTNDRHWLIDHLATV